MKNSLLITFLLISFWSFSQKKTLQTTFCKTPITIDGKLDENDWKTALIATDFVMFDPDNGKSIPNEKRTEVKVLYDNNAVYIAAVMYDNEPSKILREITKRDEFGTSDGFGVFINGFNDGQQDFQFYVSASDSQADCVVTAANGEDYSWDAVWSSKAIITSFGWIVEMKIPYAALRFSAESKQTWGLNFFREIKRDRHKYSWNFIDNKTNAFIQQAGILEGIQNIKPPTRLFLLPYSSFYLNSDANQKTFGTLKGGMDIKYGINDAFTLDAVLIPDFGQTKFDDKILNLSPFEQQFNENRPFFTEGTDLFSKGGLLYSRRIGQNGNPTLKDNEVLIKNSSTVNLINATKVSGRTKGGLGIGFLNAVTENTTATVENTDTNYVFQKTSQPLTNYNVLVLDQRFRKNSSVSFVNTSVFRNGHFRDADVAALVWDLNTKKNTYNLSGNFKYSFVYDNGKKDGTYTTLNIAETSGKYRYSLGGDLVTKHFDNNDLGINFETNYFDVYGNGSYRILNPTKLFNSFNINLNGYTQFQKESGKVQGNNFNININTVNKKNHYFGIGVNVNPLVSFDYYEPRTEGRFLAIPKRMGTWMYFSSNYNYKFAFDFNPSFAVLEDSGRNSYGCSLGPRYRFNDHFSLNYNFNFFRQNNNKGCVDSENPDEIVIANRNVITYSNALSAKYSVNSTMSFNLSIRHYWSFAENKNFFKLENDGSLSSISDYTTNRNSNFSAWNLDLAYLWWFAPGSQVSILYRNNAANFEREINKDFGQNVTGILNNQALSHAFSISVKYFIDYNRVKNWH